MHSALMIAVSITTIYQALESTSYSMSQCSSAYLFCRPQPTHLPNGIQSFSRNSDELESKHFAGRSADYAWQLFLASLGILVRQYL